MTRIKLKHIQRFKDRHGKMRHYARIPGCQRVTLPGEWWNRRVTWFLDN